MIVNKVKPSLIPYLILQSAIKDYNEMGNKGN